MEFSSARERQQNTAANLVFAIDAAMNDASLKGQSVTVFSLDQIDALFVSPVIGLLRKAGYTVEHQRDGEQKLTISWCNKE